MRVRVNAANRDLGGADFVWVPEDSIVSRSVPADAVLLERLEWGPFHGFLDEVRRGDRTLASGAEAWPVFRDLLRQKIAERERIEHFEDGPIGDLNRAMEAQRLEARRIELSDASEDEKARRRARLESEQAEARAEFEVLSRRLFAMRDALAQETVLLRAADGTRKVLPVGEIVRAVRPNRMGLLDKLGLYFARVGEFLSADPRESNTEGGIFPAIFGTVMMVFLMSIAVGPFGVLAAVYLREYARQGPVVRLVRIAVNNLAGVPSIVYGVFGLGFFVYLIGGTIDSLFYAEALPSPTYGTGGILWASLTLALLTVPVVIVATEEGLAAVPRIVREGRWRSARRSSRRPGASSCPPRRPAS